MQRHVAFDSVRVTVPYRMTVPFNPIRAASRRTRSPARLSPSGVESSCLFESGFAEGYPFLVGVDPGGGEHLGPASVDADPVRGVVEHVVMVGAEEDSVAHTLLM
jgi:hypothetical protein